MHLYAVDAEAVRAMRNGPPEDCGGVPGFYDVLEAPADPEHDEHETAITGSPTTTRTPSTCCRSSSPSAGSPLDATPPELASQSQRPEPAAFTGGLLRYRGRAQSDQVRGTGEPSLIAGIARTILRDHPADPVRVRIAGLSAGGSAATIIAAAYPDVFAAAGLHSGLPAGAARNTASAFLAMQQGAPGDRPTVSIPTIVFHGDADTVVHPRNGRFVVARTLSAHPRLK